MNASHPERKNEQRRELPKVEIPLELGKQFVLKNKDERTGKEVTIRLIPHHDGNVSLAVFNGTSKDDPVWTKKLWAEQIQQATERSVNKLADTFPTAARAKEMEQNNVPHPKQPRPSGNDRNGIKRL